MSTHGKFPRLFSNGKEEEQSKLLREILALDPEEARVRLEESFMEELHSSEVLLSPDGNEEFKECFCEFLEPLERTEIPPDYMERPCFCLPLAKFGLSSDYAEDFVSA